MNIRWRRLLGSLSILVIGGVLGCFTGFELTAARADKSFRALMLYDAALKTDQSIRLSRNAREGNQECVAESVELSLDFAIVKLAGYYTPEFSDLCENAAKSLASAREYRAAFPHTPGSKLLANPLEVALALRTADQSQR